MVAKNKILFIVTCLGLLLLAFQLNLIGKKNKETRAISTHFWNFQSVDAMKYSRDLAREKLKDNSFDKTIDQQTAAIAETGATHVAIGVPYDEEFLPILRRWVKSARSHGLKVWFRGNFSGWEGWFEYKRITRPQHLDLVKKFIINNTDLFSDGDLFSSCPECENGGPGDPRHAGDVASYRQFLIEESEAVKLAFSQIGKKIPVNLHSMNGDVARLVMDKETTKKLGGLVVVDHYVKTPEKLVADVNDLANQSGGMVILGEFGAPIPDIHGSMNEDEQAAWVDKALHLLSKQKTIFGLNYWTGFGGSTKLWDDDGSPRKVVSIVKKYFAPTTISGRVVTWLKMPLAGATITLGDYEAVTDLDGNFEILGESGSDLGVTKTGFSSYLFPAANGTQITLEPLTLAAFVRSVFGR